MAGDLLHLHRNSTGLSRSSVGLSDAHRKLICLLAQRAIEIYLEEVEAAETAPQPEARETVLR